MEELDLNLLRILVALDRTRHAGRAAIELGMSQSGFSTALSRLRRQLGEELFIRTSTGMRPTPAAVEMAEAAREFLRQIDSDLLGAREFTPETATITFRLAMTDPAEVVFVPELMRHLTRHAPHASLMVESPSSGPLLDRLGSGGVDVAIGFFPDLEKENLYQQPLLHHTYAGIVRAGHPVLATGLTRQTYVQHGHAVVASPTRSNSLLDASLKRERLERRVALTTPDHLSLASIIARTDLIATIPLGTAAHFARAGEVVVLALPFAPPQFTIFQYWHRRTQRDPASQWLRAQIASLFNDRTDPSSEQKRELYPTLG